MSRDSTTNRSYGSNFTGSERLPKVEDIDEVYPLIMCYASWLPKKASKRLLPKNIELTRNRNKISTKEKLLATKHLLSFYNCEIYRKKVEHKLWT